MLASATVLIGAAVTIAGAPSASAAPAPLHELGARRTAGHVAPHLPQGSDMAALDALPAAVDLRTWAVPVGNQGTLSSCVTWAIDYAMLGWYSRHDRRAGQPFAPMYAYSQINGGSDTGSYPTAALDLAVAQGNDTRADYAQGDYDWRDQPTAAERSNAAHYKIAGYQTLFAGANQAGTTALLQQALAQHKPVAIELAVRNGFDRLGASTTAVDDDVTSPVRGYHEVLALGYDAHGLLIQNSWGTGWAAGGYGRLSWRVVQHDVWEGDVIDGFAPDTAPPTVSALHTTVAASGSLGANGSTVGYTVAWTGTGVGPLHYAVSYQANGGAVVPFATTTASSVTLPAQNGVTYRVLVQATDADGRVGAAVGSALFRPAIAQETDARVHYAPAWPRYASSAVSGGRAAIASTAGASATFVAAGRGFAWIGARGAKYGVARVYVDGALKATIDLHAGATQTRSVLFATTFASSGTHTIKIVDAGSAGRVTVDLDAFVLSS